MTTATANLIHAWEDAGHGKAPFRMLAVISLPGPSLAEKNPIGYANAAAAAAADARAHGVACGTCDVCGAGILQNFVIRSADGKRFVVGCDCVAKSGDAGLIDGVKALKRKAAREAKEARRREEWERTRPEREAREAERREREAREAEAQEAHRAKMVEANLWVLNVLDRTPGDFAASMVRELERRPLLDLSPRCLEIIGEIYAKAKGGRRGSKAFDAALVEFEAKADIKV
jgi:hypothetical protein